MFSKIKDSLVGKIMLGYAGIVVLAIVTTLVSVFSAWQNTSTDKLVAEAYYPTILSLKQTEMLASESVGLTNNLLSPSSGKGRETLQTIHATGAAKQMEELSNISAKTEDASVAAEVSEIKHAFNSLIAAEKVVMNRIAANDSLVVVEAAAEIQTKVVPAHENLLKLIAQASEHQNQLLQNIHDRKAAWSTFLTFFYLICVVLFLAIGVYAIRFSTNTITKPIAGLSDLITMLSKGKFVSVTLNKGKDEIGRMAEAIENMLLGLKAKAEFAENIGKGNYESNFELLSAEDVMGGALIQMRDNLKHAADEDRKRNWATEGLAKFADILRTRTNNLAELSDNIISNLVKYMNANQGALFLVNDDNPQEIYIEMVACYAYNRKKFLNKRFELGQGIAGQCVQERDTIYMTNIPDDFLRITSGLGDALPRNLLLVPLRLEEQIFGVVELASFHSIEAHQIEFVEKLGESIASTIAAAKVNSRTRKLLEETQVQAEQMRAQEEEMRQNMEELSATQEEMHRAQRRSEDLVREMKQREEELLLANKQLQSQLQSVNETETSK
jgi:GAF domain-containing protein